MAAGKHYKNSLERAKRIKALTQMYYEPGNNARCYKAVWRCHVYPIYPMCYRTYLNYLNMDREPEAGQTARQLSFIDQLFGK